MRAISARPWLKAAADAEAATAAAALKVEKDAARARDAEMAKEKKAAAKAGAYTRPAILLNLSRLCH
jgi:hypothetical protein